MTIAPAVADLSSVDALCLPRDWRSGEAFASRAGSLALVGCAAAADALMRQ